MGSKYRNNNLISFFSVSTSFLHWQCFWIELHQERYVYYYKVKFDFYKLKVNLNSICTVLKYSFTVFIHSIYIIYLKLQTVYLHMFSFDKLLLIVWKLFLIHSVYFWCMHWIGQKITKLTFRINYEYSVNSLFNSFSPSLSGVFIGWILNV